MTAGVMHYPPRLDQPGDLVQRGRVSQWPAPKTFRGPPLRGVPKQTQGRSGAGVWPISKPFWASGGRERPSLELTNFQRASRSAFLALKNTLQLRQLQELTPEQHAEGVVDIRSPGWSEAEPWVLNVHMRPALKERQRVASTVLECWDR